MSFIFTHRIYRSLLQSPARVSIFGFVILIFIGTLLLMLPAASTTKGLCFEDALFTSTSASCVTGLAVTDTGHGLSLFGQLVILLLIQLGGLGIMTFSTLVLLMAGKRPSLAGRFVIQDTLTGRGERSLYSVLRDIITFTFVFEGLGMVVMFFRFIPNNGISHALYLSLFHSVSAFCNAGFSLFHNSLSGYQNDWILNMVTSLLIVSGGIGFLVISELKHKVPYSRRRLSQLSLHSKVVLSTTVTLIVASWLLITLMEWDNTLSALSFPNRFLAGFFQAISARTAGFNTLPIGNLANETLFLLILLMFIGASPGSCGGGIKTSTFATLILLGVSRLRGLEKPQIFHRTISHESVGKAVSIIMISMLVVIIGTMLLLMTELGEVPHPMSRGNFLELLFEVVSAFGTVGLSTGLTGGLTAAGKIILTVIMFVGRLGPLVIAMALSRKIAPKYRYAEETIMIG